VDQPGPGRYYFSRDGLTAWTVDGRTLYRKTPTGGWAYAGPGPAVQAQRSIPTPSESNGMALASFVLALVGLVVGGLILGTLAIIFGLIGLGTAGSRGGAGKGQATAGILIGIVDVVGAIIVLSLFFTFFRV
jgi:hypothetical protein